jgi:hypothetical protein
VGTLGDHALDTGKSNHRQLVANLMKIIQHAAPSLDQQVALFSHILMRNDTVMDKSKCSYHFSFSIEIDTNELYM